MADQIRTFAFDHMPVRVVAGDDGEPRWVASDVAKALGYTAESGAGKVMQHVPVEWREGGYPIPTPSGVQKMAVLTEQGLYFFLGRSDKPGALPMQKWIAGEVLPSIRRTGSYRVQSTLPQNYLEALKALVVSEEAKATLTCKVQEDAPKVEFADRVSESTDGQSIGEVAKILGTGQNRLFAWLRGQQILMGSNLPYQEHVDAGRFRVIEQTWEGKSGQHVSAKTIVTGKGLIWITKKWDEDQTLTV